MKRGRVLSVQHHPTKPAQAVAVALGSAVPVLEKRTLIKGGKPIASTYERKKA